MNKPTDVFARPNASAAGLRRWFGRKGAPLIVVFSVLLGGLFANSTPAHANPPTPAEQVVAMINQTRAAAGVCPMTLDLGLTHVAGLWSIHLAHHNLLAHNTGGLGFMFSGENVGYGSDLGVVHQKFVASPPHYANITNRSFSHVGVGAVASGSRLYVTYNFVSTPHPC